MKPPYSNLLKEAGPDQYYDLLVPEEILEMIAEQTNLFASQNITARQTKPGSISFMEVNKQDRNKTVSWAGLVYGRSKAAEISLLLEQRQDTWTNFSSHRYE